MQAKPWLKKLPYRGGVQLSSAALGRNKRKPITDWTGSLRSGPWSCGFSASADSVVWCEQPRGNLHDSKFEWFISCKYWRGLKVIPINLHPRLLPWEAERSLVCQVTSYNCTLPVSVSMGTCTSGEKQKICMYENCCSHIPGGHALGTVVLGLSIASINPQPLYGGQGPS